MSEAVTVENINVAEVMDREGAKEAAGKLLNAMEAEPAVAKLLEVAETVEDAYAVVKNYLKMKLEDFKVLFNKTVDYFKEAKTALSDEMMDNIVGGSWLGDFWNKYKKAIISTVIVVGAIAASAATGGALAGVAGAVIGGVVGAAGGAGCAIAYNQGGITASANRQLV